jgi:hypothetical protein
MANKKISALDPAPAPLTGSELLEIVQDGASYRTTAQDIADLSPATPTPTLQQVTDQGSTTTTTITASRFLGSGAGAKATPHHSFSTDDNNGMWLSGADQVSLVTNSLNRMQVLANGDVDFRGSSDSQTNVRFVASGNGQMSAVQTTTACKFTTYVPVGSGTGFTFEVAGSTVASMGRFLLFPSGTTTQTSNPMLDILDSSSIWSAPYIRVRRGTTDFHQVTVAGETQIRSLNIFQGTNFTIGTATLVAGTVTVNNTKITTNSKVFVTGKGTGANAGRVNEVKANRVAATSFQIESDDVADTQDVDWWIIEPY